VPEIRSALFVDFDNIFGGLLELDREAGLAFAREPSKWLARLRGNDADGGSGRRFLQSRAYLNPNGWLMDAELGNDAGRLYLQKFRPNLTRAGFEVIDCPALTRQQKNAADIRIVIDILTSLETGNPIDEIVIASSDADFTPLLHLLRARDRRTVVMSASQVSSAYEAVADEYLGPESMISLMSPPKPSQLASTPSGDPGADAQRIILDLVADSDDPVQLPHVGIAVRAVLNGEVDDSSWFGHRSLSAFARSLATGNGRTLEADQRFLWDPDRHDPPDDDLSDDPHRNLPQAIRDLRSTTDFPPLPSETWPVLFEALADHAATEVFSLSSCTMSIRDRLRETPTPVSRQIVGHVVKGAKLGGVRLDAHPPPSAAEIRSAFMASVVDRHESGGLQLRSDEEATLDRWLSGAGVDGDDPAQRSP
jgi:hypothetical protein